MADIKILSSEVQVSRQFVLSMSEPLRASSPQSPRSAEEVATLPPDISPFGLVVHVGVGPPGGIKVASRARKPGYTQHDVDVILAPYDHHEIHPSLRPCIPNPNPASLHPLKPYAGMTPAPISVRLLRTVKWPKRDALEDPLNVEELIRLVKEQGVKDIEHSSDAGMLLGELMYYCPISFSHRKKNPVQVSYEHGDGGPNFQGPPRSQAQGNTKVLFIRVPPIGQPQCIEEMTFAIEEIIKVVCWGMNSN
ncbi:uncharacterized protein EI90DRAFT_3017906 [Cantharellus anzutake]|uniref:uncharacterized protein n=1 Tax=Cantharellus anzutake TaxID=1750568 RepID=UPI001907126C|nr:uncharacterized protein EI90DRAFT_3017906 [Cantharellus anzutake]KAF8327893.1 hypothetical protein EI90DRAFT_3017906 [Cantharellus anzutake]